MKTAIIALLVIVGLLSLPSLLDPESAAVKKICGESHKVNSGYLEERCGAIQDATHTEFLCDGLEASSNCWVEHK